MNRQIRLLGAGIIVLFVALFVQLNYVQIVHAKALEQNPLNGRAIVKEYTSRRGSIVSADGVTLATSAPSNDSLKYLRQYPTGALFGEVTGYYSFEYGSDGAERYYDKVLTGSSSPFKFPTSLNAVRQLFTNTNHSQNVTLTLLNRLQTVAKSELAGRTGSVVALDPTTGAILAMYSNPSFDPNGLASHNLRADQAAYKSITAVPGGPLDPPAYRQTWFPGSSFKVVTASGIFDHNPALANKSYPYIGALTLPNSNLKLHNFAGEVCGGQLLALFTVSCDTGFGQVGLDLGPSNMSAEARSFGFDQVPPVDLPFAAKSNFPAASTFQGALAFLAYSAIGQEDVQASPLEMALVAGAIADHGTIMTPHILQEVTNAQAQVVSTFKPKPWLQATSTGTAGQLTQLMLSVVNSANGTGVAARVPGVQVAGKTGTAQTGTGQTDDWFVAFAPANNPRIAVSVVLPNEPSANEYQGGTVAAPIARAMIEAALSGTGLSGNGLTNRSTTPPVG